MPLKQVVIYAEHAPRLYHREDRLDFGQYRTCILEDIIDTDPRYVVWLTENVKWFHLDAFAEEQLDAALYDLNDQDSYSYHSSPYIRRHTPDREDWTDYWLDEPPH